MRQDKAAASRQDLAEQWLRDKFKYTGDASWNTPRKAKTRTPTAEEGRKTGEKRKAQFAPLESSVLTVRIICSHYDTPRHATTNAVFVLDKVSQDEAGQSSCQPPGSCGAVAPRQVQVHRGRVLEHASESQDAYPNS